MKLYLTIIILFLLDRISKLLAFNLPEEGIFLFENNFYQIGFKLYENSMMAFSIPVNNLLLIIASSIITAILIYLLIKNHKAPKKNIFLITILAIIIAGALGNLFDRIYYGYVIDFIYVSFYSTFNLADVMIVGSVSAWALKELKTKN